MQEVKSQLLLTRKPVVLDDCSDETLPRKSNSTIRDMSKVYSRESGGKQVSGSCLKIDLGNGDFYEGGVFEGKFQGKGILRLLSKGIQYDGEWENNLRQGKGVETWSDGRKFVGTFKDDSKVYGDFYFADGSTYSGNFVNNELSGFGVLICPGKYNYTGSFMGSLKHGKGKITYENGDFYDGEFYKGKKHGKGVFFWVIEESIYEGDWYCDKPHGIGFVTENGNQKVKALFQEGKQISLI